MNDQSDLSLPFEPVHSRPWLYFDINFYIRTCIEHDIAPPVGSLEALLHHYRSVGAKRALSPNPLFNELYYRSRYPDVAREIEIGRWHSGLDHYATLGAGRDASPTWFFDGQFYKGMYSDLTDANLRFGGFKDSYAHYLLVGIGEKRTAHWLIRALQIVARDCGFPRTLLELQKFIVDGSSQCLVFRPILDYDWMNEKYNWDMSVKRTDFVRYYLLNVKSLLLSPSPFFDEEFYRISEPEVAASIESGGFSSGFEHFVLHGMYEWRRPFKAFDPRYYATANMIDEATTEPGLSPFVHFLRNRGRANVRIARPLSDQEIPEEHGKGLYERRCALNVTKLGDLEFCTAADTPEVSLIIVVRDNFAQTVNCLLSAAYSTRLRLEVVIFDNGSQDETAQIQTRNATIKVVRSEDNVGFTIAVNRAVAVSTAPVVLLLNNDLEVAPGAIDIAFSEIHADRSIGAIGAKIVRMHGRLQEGGSLIWSDGTCLGYGRDRDPSDGQVSFPRDVDFCSGCFLAISRSAWDDLAGFDEAFAPAYYEETDFCVRLWESGRRVVYDPRIVVWHFEFGSSSIREEPLALMRRNQRYFARKHQSYLSNCYAPAEANIEPARLRRTKGIRALFIEDRLPDPKKGMGFVRSGAIADILGRECGLLSMVGLHDQEWSTADKQSGSKSPIEVLTGINVTNLDDVFRNRVGVYNVVWLSRTHNLSHLKRWREEFPTFFAHTKVVLDTEAVAATRSHHYLQLAGQPSDLADLALEELRFLKLVDHVCVVNQSDCDLVQSVLTALGIERPISILGHALRPRIPFPRFEDTSDIVLAGSFSQLDGPNADGLIWFDRMVRPLISVPPDVRFVIAGNKATNFTRSIELRHDYVVISDPPDMSKVFEKARLMIAPTRFAGGIPMKVHEAASYGIPVLMTTLLSEQLSWRDSVLGISDAIPEAMANTAESIISDPNRWRQVQERQGALVETDCDPRIFEEAIRKMLSDNIKRE